MERAPSKAGTKATAEQKNQ
jgi:hypothetical protein